MCQCGSNNGLHPPSCSVGNELNALSLELHEVAYDVFDIDYTELDKDKTDEI
jgi:hypothetical protein